jgi:hypothetical protein
VTSALTESPGFRGDTAADEARRAAEAGIEIGRTALGEEADDARAPLPGRAHPRVTGTNPQDATVIVEHGRMTAENDLTGGPDAAVASDEPRRVARSNRALGGGTGELAGLTIDGDPNALTDLLGCHR